MCAYADSLNLCDSGCCPTGSLDELPGYVSLILSSASIYVTSSNGLGNSSNSSTNYSGQLQLLFSVRISTPIEMFKMPYNVTGSSAFQAANSTDFQSKFKLAWNNIHAPNASGALLSVNQSSQGVPVMLTSPFYPNVTYDPKSCTQAGKDCPCSKMNNITVPDDTFMNFCMSIPNAQQILLDDFGNSSRIAAIIQDWKYMQSASVDIYMVTTSWADLTPTAWGNFVFMVFGYAGGETMTTLMPQKKHFDPGSCQWDREQRSVNQFDDAFVQSSADSPSSSLR